MRIFFLIIIFFGFYGVANANDTKPINKIVAVLNLEKLEERCKVQSSKECNALQKLQKGQRLAQVTRGDVKKHCVGQCKYKYDKCNRTYSTNYCLPNYKHCKLMCNYQ